MIGSWWNGMYGAPGIPGLYHPGLLYPSVPAAPYNPDGHPIDMIAGEVRDAYRQMGYVKTLEGKLKGKSPGEGNNTDWEMLSRMKKDLGMEVDYKTETEKREEQRAADAGWDSEKH